MSSKSGNSSRMVLPNISSSTPQLSYAQKYEHMTKLANYSELNQGQIWKQYQKLRSCLKQINEQVLYHMQRKAYTNINNKQKPKITKDSQSTMMMLEDEKKTNDLRYSNFYTQLVKFEQRIHFLAGKNNYLEELAMQTIDLEGKIKQTKKDNKDYKRKAKIVGKNIVNCTSALDKLMVEEERLCRAATRHRRLKQYMESLQNKEQKYLQRIRQAQQAIDSRLKQFYSQQNYIQQQIHYERYEQFKKQKQNILKYQSIYKRSYLMKLKQLEGLVGSVGKHDRVIQENEANIINVRSEIESITQLLGKGNLIQKRRSTSSALNISINPVRIKSKENQTNGSINSTSVSIQMKQPFSTRKRVTSHMNDKNENLPKQ